jgi:hypothetical protein
VVLVLVVGMVSSVVFSLLDVVHLVLNTMVGGVIDLRWRGGTVHSFPFVIFRSPPARQGWFPNCGFHGGSCDAPGFFINLNSR